MFYFKYYKQVPLNSNYPITLTLFIKISNIFPQEMRNKMETTKKAEITNKMKEQKLNQKSTEGMTYKLNTF